MAKIFFLLIHKNLWQLVRQFINKIMTHLSVLICTSNSVEGFEKGWKRVQVCFYYQKPVAL